MLCKPLRATERGASVRAGARTTKTYGSPLHRHMFAASSSIGPAGRTLSHSPDPAAGRATCFQGRLQLQVGSSWGKIEKLTGEELQQAPPYCAAYDISAARRTYGALLLRQQQGQLLAYILPALSDPAACAALEKHCPAVPSVTAAFDEPQRMAASRWGHHWLW